LKNRTNHNTNESSVSRNDSWEQRQKERQDVRHVENENKKMSGKNRPST
jgi:hypothetical protein